MKKQKAPRKIIYSEVSFLKNSNARSATKIDNMTKINIDNCSACEIDPEINKITVGMIKINRKRGFTYHLNKIAVITMIKNITVFSGKITFKKGTSLKIARANPKHKSNITACCFLLKYSLIFTSSINNIESTCNHKYKCYNPSQIKIPLRTINYFKSIISFPINNPSVCKSVNQNMLICS